MSKFPKPKVTPARKRERECSREVRLRHWASLDLVFLTVIQFLKRIYSAQMMKPYSPPRNSFLLLWFKPTEMFKPTSSHCFRFQRRPLDRLGRRRWRPVEFFDPPVAEEAPVHGRLAVLRHRQQRTGKWRLFITCYYRDVAKMAAACVRNSGELIGSPFHSAKC